MGPLDCKQTLPYVINVLQGFRTHPYLLITCAHVPRVCIFIVTGGNTEIIAD